MSLCEWKHKHFTHLDRTRTTHKLKFCLFWDIMPCSSKLGSVSWLTHVRLFLGLFFNPQRWR
jgi:hypothetical protein